MTSATFNTYYYDNLPMKNSSKEGQPNAINDEIDFNTKIIGNKVHTFEEVNSTNEEAKKLADEGAKEGTVVIAEMQKKGKGRLNREWVSPKGGLWLSIILRPDFGSEEASKITMMAGVAAVESIIYPGLDARIKWPNDVLINGKKICGILTEMRSHNKNVDYVVLGLGINANFDLEELPEQIRGSATSLRYELGKDVNIQGLLQQIIKEVDYYYDILKSGKSNKIVGIWKKQCDTLGRNVRIITQNETIEGIALDIDDKGALAVRAGDGKIHKFLAGDCIHISSIL